MRLWKGLYYSMWLADKTPVQLDLAERLATMMHAFRGDLGVDFQRAFWRTIVREWHTLDHHRLDKYYALIRRYVREGLVYCANREWSEKSLADFAAIFAEAPLQYAALLLSPC